MSEDLTNEIEVINSIYGDDTLNATDEANTYTLKISCFSFPLKLHFDSDYPSSPPTLLGSDTSGTVIRREDSSHAVELFKDVLNELFEPSQVCLYDVIEEVTIRYQAEATHREEEIVRGQNLTEFAIEKDLVDETQLKIDPPEWILSDVVTELKSVFIARTARVTSPEQAKHYVQHLLDSDKKVRAATHNITAWRMRDENGVVYQDQDDDGEAAAGGRLLHLMQLMDLWNCVVVVTRWYGGHHLGPKRFALINQVARDAFVKADYVDEAVSKKKGKR